MIIRHTPREGLVPAARVCRYFQLEAEARLYENIVLLSDQLNEKHFPALKHALLSQTRRQAYVRTLGRATKSPNRQNVKFWWEALSFLLPILSNLKSLHIHSLDAPEDIDSEFLLHLPSRLETLWFQAQSISSDRQNVFYESQPHLRTLHTSHSAMAPISSHLLTRLEVVAGSCKVMLLCLPGRPVKRVLIVFITKHSKMY